MINAVNTDELSFVEMQLMAAKIDAAIRERRIKAAMTTSAANRSSHRLSTHTAIRVEFLLEQMLQSFRAKNYVRADELLTEIEFFQGNSLED